MSTRVILAIVLLNAIGHICLGAPPSSPAQNEIDVSLAAIDRTERNLPQITKIAETIATRHLKGGNFGCPLSDQAVMAELTGRSGNFMFFGLRPKQERTDEQ